jgi:uncharacterized membrane protein
MNWLKMRFKEPSTWFAVFAMTSTFLGIEFLPEQKDAIIMLAIALLGGSGISTKDS